MIKKTILSHTINLLEANKNFERYYLNKDLNNNDFEIFKYKNKYVFMVARHNKFYNQLLIFKSGDTELANPYIKISELLESETEDKELKDFILFNLDIFQNYESQAYLK